MTSIYEKLFGKRGATVMANPAAEATLSLPDALAPYAEAIRATEQEIINAGFSPDQPLTVGGSQLGGLPWWPKSEPYPTGSSGAPLFLLAQIDLADLPALAPLPRSGLLQVFIGNDDLYGCNVDNVLAPTAFRCVLHRDTSAQRLTAFDALEKDWARQQMLPLDDPLIGRPLRFAPSRMPVDTSDYRFEALLPDIAASEELSELYFEWKLQELDISAIRLGGYPTFTQDDPRKWRTHENYKHYEAIGDFSLLTIDTTDGIMWGDSGAAQFLAQAADLERGDVARVVYNWDCL